MLEGGLFWGPVAVRPVPGKGRGVFATRSVAEGELLAADPCLPLTAGDCRALAATSLHGHPFAHPEAESQGCLVLGPIGLVNHGADPNCRLSWTGDEGTGWTVVLHARRPIAEGEELTYDYDVELWFEPVT